MGLMIVLKRGYIALISRGTHNSIGRHFLYTVVDIRAVLITVVSYSRTLIDSPLVTLSNNSSFYANRYSADYSMPKFPSSRSIDNLLVTVCSDDADPARGRRGIPPQEGLSGGKLVLVSCTDERKKSVAISSSMPIALIAGYVYEGIHDLSGSH